MARWLAKTAARAARAAEALGALLLALTTAGCAAARSGLPAPHQAKQAGLFGEDHPLRGRIYDVGAAAFISSEALVDRLAAAPHVLLGEKHDNPEHHRLQAQLLQALVARGRRPAVVWEMIPLAQQPTLDRLLDQPGADVAALGSSLRWETTGWPPWPLYQPIAEVALAHRLPLRAAGLDRAQLLAVIHGGVEGAPAELQAPLPELRRPLPEPAAADLAAEIRQAHCGHTSPRQEQRMVLAQQLKDLLMARQMLGPASPPPAAPQGALLIAGNGHARRDRGVPFQLRALAGDQGAPAAALGIVEVQQGESDPAAYAAGVPDLGPAFDFLWFTTRVDNDDPCARFRERLEQLEQQQGEPAAED